MVEMAKQPPNLDRLMNEGVAFVINQVRHRLHEFTVGQHPVMLGNRKPHYDSIDKVMKRLDLIYTIMNAMNFAIVDVK